MRWSVRGLILAGLIIVLGASFAARARRSPVIDARYGALPTRNELGEEDVVVFILDTPLDPAFVGGRTLDVSEDDISHGSLVARVVRRYCRVPVAGLPSEGATREQGRDKYRQSLRQVLSFCNEHPDLRIIVNLSLGRGRPSDDEKRLLHSITQTGAIVIAAAGNDNSPEKSYPAAYEHVIAVASAEPTGKALHSNYGEWVDIAASGDITFIDREFLPYEQLLRRMESVGTSFASPRIAAAVAWTLQRRPEMKPTDAWETLRQSASTMPDAYFERGQLGAGYLDLYRLKSSLRPHYHLVHYALPVVFFGTVAIASGIIVWKLGMAGIFVALLIWLVAVPSGIVMASLLRRYLEVVRAGFRTEGLWPLVLVWVSCAGGALIVKFESDSQLLALGPGAGLALLLRLAGIGAPPRSILIATALLAGAIVRERTIRRKIDTIRNIPEQLPDDEAEESLLHHRDEASNCRVRATARRTLNRLRSE
ncbi:MAG: S8 family serine peptidase [Candidatus Brocadiia bacterium]